MAVRPIVLYPDPVLQRPARPVERFDGELARLADDLADTMYDAPGVGLAAPQVGVELRVAVVDVGAPDGGADLRVLVNPRVVSGEGRVTAEEGCLSIPGLAEKVDRPASVRVAAQGLRGEPFEFEATGLLARACCHEIDHLDGILFFQRLAGLRRELTMRRLRRLPLLRERTA
jgi:peptide deformylase